MPRETVEKSRSLTASIVRGTLTIEVIVVMAALLVTIFGSYRIARAHAQDRMGAYLEVMRSELMSRLTATGAVLDNIGAEIAQLPASKVTAGVLASKYVSASELVGDLLVLDPEGELVASYPTWRGAKSDYVFASNVATSVVTFHHVPRVGERSPTLWAVRRVTLADKSDRIVLGRVRAGFMRSMANRAASLDEQRAAAVVSGESAVVTGTSGPPIRLDTAVYEEQEPSDGAAGLSLVAPGLGTMRGLWIPLNGLQGLDWRLIAAEPLRSTMESAVQAATPMLFVLLLGSAVGVGVAAVVSRRVVQPLRDLEKASYDAAQGAYLSPLRPTSDDEVGRLAGAFNAVALRLNALHDVSHLLAGATRLDQVVDAVVEAMSHLLGPGMVAVYLLDEDEHRLRLCCSSGDFEPPAGPLLVARSGPLGEALHARDVMTPGRDALPGAWGLSDEVDRVMVVPLVAATEQLGVVVVLQRGRPQYTDAEIEMARTFSVQAAIGISKSQSFEREMESRRIAESLRDVAQELVRPGSLSETLQAVNERVSRSLGAQHIAFAFKQPSALGLPDPSRPDVEEAMLSLAEAVSTRSGAQASAIVTPGTTGEADALLEAVGAHEMIVASIDPEESYGGALVVYAGAHPFGPRDIELVDGVAGIVTLALDQAFFQQRSRVRAQNLETIFRVSQAVGSSLQLKVVLNRVLDVVQMIFAADAVSLMTYEPSGRTVSTAMARGMVSAEILHFEVGPGEDLPGKVFSSGRPARVSDLSESDLPLAVAASEVGLKSLLAVPLIARGTSVGVLNVFSESGDAFEDEDMSLLQTFASQAALAIDTARLYGKEHDVAAILQQSILPQSAPSFAEVDVATAYEPAGGEADIGGDYFDLFRTTDGRIVIAIGDVCGKGVQAATKTSMIKYSVRSLVAAGLGVGQCLMEINEMIVAENNVGDILSVWLGFLDAAAGELVWANGGHPPGLLMRGGTREIERLATTGPILGAQSGVRYEEETVEVAQGDTILLYTDGVTESRDGNRFFGEGRVRRALHYGGSASDVVGHLLSALARFAPEELHDDVAVVAIRVKETGTRSAR